MTAVAFQRPVAPPSTRSTWQQFLLESLDPVWRAEEWDPETWTFVGILGTPMTNISVCLRPGCQIIVDGANQWCNGCRKARRLAGTGELPPRMWNERSKQQRDRARRFCLAGLRPEVRSEILFGLQEGDRQQLAVRPILVSLLVRKIPAQIETVLDMPDSGLPGMQRSLLRAIQQRIRRLRTVHDGNDGTAGDVWDCAVVGLLSRPDQPYPAVTGKLDFTVIRQRWLRDIALAVLRAKRPAVTECHRYLQSAAIASSVLSGRPNGNSPTELAAGDMSAVCQAFKSATSKKGKPFSDSHRRALLGWWRRLMDYARSAGLMDSIPGTFAVREDDMFGTMETSGDVTRAIPEEWIAHFDAHLHLLGTSSGYEPAGWASEDLREMYGVFYQVLRDTGRRPSEIARLPIQPVEYVKGQPTLIYDNRKAGRLSRRLPIHSSTAAVIEQWTARLAILHIPHDCEGLLFPAPGARNRARRGHLNAGQFRRAFVAWLRMLPAPAGLSEAAADFPVENIDPYGFRHAYAQRHADNGTPIDVLRDLMDHKEIKTTMGYYQVTLTRKQKAVELVSQLALDRHGSPAPFPTDLAYERASVATAYGNCTEPSNVKAGGKSCPIRFQCSGCGFYRPDPSYLAAIEQQLSQLHADRAIALASDVARWVLDNLDEQIKSYDRIAATMREQLAALNEPERRAIESACTDLRKARQAVLIPAESLTRRPD